MKSVFVGGSRRLAKMNPQLSQRLDNIVRTNLRVIVGDANGFDRVAQAYLADRHYGAVVVYCTAGECRNNVGDWTVCAVDYDGLDRGRAFYTAKDDAMLRDADYGLFAWDGKSQGTLRNVQRMAEQGKPSAVYVSPLKRFLTVRTADDAWDLSRDAASALLGSEDLFSDTWRESTSVAEMSTGEG